MFICEFVGVAWLTRILGVNILGNLIGWYLWESGTGGKVGSWKTTQN